MKKPLYLAVFSDIDGTLLNTAHQITPLTRQAIQSVMQKGIPFIPVSARPPLAITPYTQQLQSYYPIICYSGALILDQDLSQLYSVVIEQADLNRLDLLLMETILNVNQDQVIAFGDNFNDLDMLQYAGLSVAMGNAPEEIKAAAKRVTLSNNDDGIAVVLNEIFN